MSVFHRLNAISRQYPRQFWLLFWGMLISTIGASMIWPFILIYLSKKLDVPLTVVTLLTALNNFTGLAFSFLAGPIIDRIGDIPGQPTPQKSAKTAGSSPPAPSPARRRPGHALARQSHSGPGCAPGRPAPKSVAARRYCCCAVARRAATQSHSTVLIVIRLGFGVIAQTARQPLRSLLYILFPQRGLCQKSTDPGQVTFVS